MTIWIYWATLAVATAISLHWVAKPFHDLLRVVDDDPQIVGGPTAHRIDSPTAGRQAHNARAADRTRGARTRQGLSSPASSART